MAVSRHLFHAGLIAIALAAAIPAQAAQEKLHWSTYLRDAPDETAHVIDELTRGATLDIGACNARWCRVAVEGATGYIDKDAVSLPSPPDGAGKIDAAQGCFWDRQYSFRIPDQTEFCGIKPSGAAAP